MMPSLFKQQQPASIDHLQDTAINVVYNVCSIVTMPVEMALRPFHGTRYFPPVIMVASAMMMIFIPLVSSFAGAMGSFLPFPQMQSPGLVGMWGLSRLFFLGCLIHGIRKWRLMLHMEKEKSSIFAGPPLFFFNWLPKASFWRTRIVYEPAFLVVLSIILPNFFILEPAAGNFLLFSAIFLAMKNYTGWYLAWQYLRELMDMKFAGPIIAAMAEGSETEEQMASINLASFPTDLDPEIRKAAIEHLAHVARVVSE